MVAQELEADGLLVVCPAMARRVWERQIARWWPERVEEVCTLTVSPERTSQSKKRKAAWPALLQHPVRIVSPELLDVEREREFRRRFKRPHIVLDEVHAYVNPASERSIAMRALLDGYNSSISALTGTPIPNRLSGLWNPLDLVWPTRFGVLSHDCDGIPRVPWKFLNRHLERTWNGHGWVWTTQRLDTADELAYRIGALSSRVTRKQIAAYLPRCQLDALPIDASKTSAGVWQDWLNEAIASGAEHVVMAFHRRASVAIAKQLKRPVGWVGVAMTGADPAGRRDELLESARKAPRSVVFTTFHAVKESIDLSWNDRALLAELYWRPATLTQYVARFGRPEGTPTLMHVLCKTGSVNERMAVAVAEKLQDSARVLPEGQTEGSLRGAMQPLSYEDMMAAAMSVVVDADELAGLDESEDE